MNISQYSTLSDPAAGDMLLAFSAGNSDTRKMTLSALTAYILAQDTTDDTTGLKQEYTTQYASPSATGFNIQVTDGSDNIWLIIKPTDDFLSGGITMPSTENAVDKQEVMVTHWRNVTSFTVLPNGDATDAGNYPISISGIQSFTMKYDAFYDIWVGVTE